METCLGVKLGLVFVATRGERVSSSSSVILSFLLTLGFSKYSSLERTLSIVMQLLYWHPADGGNVWRREGVL